MAQLTTEDLKGYQSSYDSSRDVGDVLVGEDAARLFIEASLTGNDTAVQRLLSLPGSVETMLEKPHRITDIIRPRQDPNTVRRVSARPVSNLEWVTRLAALNGQATVVSTLLAFATQQNISVCDIIVPRLNLAKIIWTGGAAVVKAIASADPSILNVPIGHSDMLPLYEAVRLRKTDVVAVMLELGADPLHPTIGETEGTFHKSLMSHAAMSRDPRMTEMLLERNTPINHTGALYTAANFGDLDTMRLLMQHGADVNEVLSNSWDSWTPMHFAATKGQADAMELLEQNGARSDAKDNDGKTPAQVLQEVLEGLRHANGFQLKNEE
jgi:hypothetical protein